MRGRHSICVDVRLDEKLKFKIKLHELAHHILHTGKPHFYLLDPNRREECEAEVFALCALIPLKWVKTKTLRELVEDECIPEEFVYARKNIYENYKI